MSRPSRALLSACCEVQLGSKSVPEPFDHVHKLMSGLALDVSEIFMVDCFSTALSYSSKIATVTTIYWGILLFDLGLYVRFRGMPRVGPAERGMEGWPWYQVRTCSPLC